jgi:ADP-heptose:LPS heptosyltransferase
MSMKPHASLELACLASGAVLRVGPYHPRAFPAFNVELRGLAVQERYRGERTAPLAPFLGLADSDLDAAWPLPADRLRQSARLVHFNKPDSSELLVGVDPGLGKSGHGIAHQNLLFLTRQLASQTRCRFLPLSDPDNQPGLRDFENRLGNVPQGLSRETLMETVLLLAQCDLFLAGNTDLFHFAVALEVPTVGIFTPRDGADWDPGPRPCCRVLRVTRGERVDVATLMEAVEAVRGMPTAQTSPLGEALQTAPEAAPGAQEPAGVGDEDGDDAPPDPTIGESSNATPASRSDSTPREHA